MRVRILGREASDKISANITKRRLVVDVQRTAVLLDKITNITTADRQSTFVAKAGCYRKYFGFWDSGHYGFLICPARCLRLDEEMLNEAAAKRKPVGAVEILELNCRSLEYRRQFELAGSFWQ